MRWRSWSIWGVCGGAALALAPHGDAEACGNAIEIRVDPRTNAVAEAERLVGRGKPDEAVKRILAADGGFASAKVGSGPLADRALLVFAQAIARSDGRVGLGGGAPSEGDHAASEKNLAWAAAVTTGLSTKRTDDPSIASSHGEVLSRIPSREAEAKRVLEALEKRDVVASPFAYAALARLRGERAAAAPAFVRGPLRSLEAARREIELSRCRSMTQTPEICVTAGGSG
jgi:hypothetical protein